MAWYENFLAVKKAIGNAEFLEQFARESLGGAEKGGRPPIYWKSDFVLDLAELWRIMTGHDASKDSASPFSSFVAAAWASLGNDLPEVSWTSQIRRREEIPSAAKLVERANSVRFVFFRFENNPDRTEPRIGGGFVVGSRKSIG
jgi:hypothetical protein